MIKFFPSIDDFEERPIWINIVDFDWAGKVGEVRYPICNHKDGIPWPGEDWNLIEQDHDAQMVESWSLH